MNWKGWLLPLQSVAGVVILLVPAAAPSQVWGVVSPSATYSSFSKTAKDGLFAVLIPVLMVVVVFFHSFPSDVKNTWKDVSASWKSNPPMIRGPPLTAVSFTLAVPPLFRRPPSCRLMFLLGATIISGAIRSVFWL